MSPAAALGFVGASLLLAVTPGPGVAYIVTRTLAQGRTAGLASVAGVAAGNLGSAAAAAFGLAALLQASRAAFLLVTALGAAYLVALGAARLRRALRRAAPGEGPGAVSMPPVRIRRLAVDGFVVALLNPKTALFYVAFLPPFIDPARAALPQALGLGTVFVAIAAASDAGYVWAAGRLGAALARRADAVRRVGLARAGEAATGCALIGLGALGAWTGLRRAA